MYFPFANCTFRWKSLAERPWWRFERPWKGHIPAHTRNSLSVTSRIIFTHQECEPRGGCSLLLTDFEVSQNFGGGNGGKFMVLAPPRDFPQVTVPSLNHMQRTRKTKQGRKSY